MVSGLSLRPGFRRSKARSFRTSVGLYQKADNGFAVSASAGGANKNLEYHNLKVNPNANVEVILALRSETSTLRSSTRFGLYRFEIERPVPDDRGRRNRLEDELRSAVNRIGAPRF